MATFRDLPSPADELAEAVALLLDRACAEIPPLLAQLVDGAESSSSRGGAARNRQTAPASLDVLGLLISIDRCVAQGLRRAGYRGRLDLDRAVLVRAWAARVAGWGEVDPGYLRASVAEARRWVTRAENILTPDPQIVEVQAQPCPAPECGERTAMVYSEDVGERVQRPSMCLDKAHMIVYCRCCGTRWPSEMWNWLRRVLEDRAAR